MRLTKVTMIPRAGTLLLALLFVGCGNPIAPGDAGPLSDSPSGNDSIATDLAESGLPGITVTAPGNTLTSESGTQTSFSVVLDSKPTAVVSLCLASSDEGEGALVIGQDVLAGDATCPQARVEWTADNWNDPRTVLVVGVDDEELDGNQPFEILIGPATSEDAAYDGLDPKDLQFVNTDDDRPGITVKLQGPALTTESGGSVSISMVLNSKPTASVHFCLWTSDTSEGSVVVGGDVSPADPPCTVASIFFSPENWNAPKVVQIVGVDDAFEDGNQAYRAFFGIARSDDLGYQGMDPLDPLIVNIDDDQAGVTVDQKLPAVTSESGTSSSFVVVLNSQPVAPVEFCLSVSDKTEATLAVTGDLQGPGALCPEASLVFDVNDWNKPKTVSVVGADDGELDGPQNYSVILSELNSADPKYSGLNPDDLNFTNADDDAPGITVIAGFTMLTSESGASSSFGVVLSSKPQHPVKICLNSSDPSEGVVAIGGDVVGSDSDCDQASIEFTAATWNLAKEVAVVGVDDSDLDGNISYKVTLSPAISLDEVYSGVTGDSVSFVNADDDGVGIEVKAGISMLTSESGTESAFTVVLTSKPTAAVKICVASTDTNEGVVVVAGGVLPPDADCIQAALLFDPNDWNQEQIVAIRGVDDLVEDGNRTYTVVLEPAISNDEKYHGIDPDDVAYTNIDDDTAGITVGAGAVNLTSEIGGAAEFVVVLNSQPSSTVKICLEVSEKTEGYILKTAGDTLGPDADCNDGRLEFTTNNWSVAQVVKVVGVNDSVQDGNQSYKVTLAPAISADPEYSGLDADDVNFLNVDDDSFGVTVSAGPSKLTSESGSRSAFSIVLNSKPTEAIEICLL